MVAFIALCILVVWVSMVLLLIRDVVRYTLKVIPNLRWIFVAKGLCKRYNLKLLFVRPKGLGCGGAYFKDEWLYVDPTAKHYLTTFMHELGHHFDFKHRSRYSMYTKRYKGYRGSMFTTTSHRNIDLVNPLFTKEANASRHAMRLLKLFNRHTEDNERYLQWCYTTYVPKKVESLKGSVAQDIADVASFGYKRIKSGLDGRYTSKQGYFHLYRYFSVNRLKGLFRKNWIF